MQAAAKISKDGWCAVVVHVVFVLDEGWGGAFFVVVFWRGGGRMCVCVCVCVSFFFFGEGRAKVAKVKVKGFAHLKDEIESFLTPHRS